ncbi:glycosyltransferase family 2 protein [Streptomyces sp. NPDC002088]|uniref:glycosyltransferase n=1 Tax=Streptomyces sp. NPDC002088 TaxID=3154665 RepID=UPI003322FD37
MTKESGPSHPDVARRTADCVVISADPTAADANPFYMHRARPLLTAVLDILAETDDKRLSEAVADLRRSPADPSRYGTLVSAVAELLGKSPELSDRLARALDLVNAKSRIGYHRGDYAGREFPPVRTDSVEPAEEELPGIAPIAQVVIPFRDSSASGERLENLLSCLRALRDQSIPGARYIVTVVECDVEPRWRGQVEQFADEYVHAYKSGDFNRSWGLNVGVVNCRSRTPYVCVLDADALVDRDFVKRNVERFLAPAVGAFLPFTDLLYLDRESSRRAVARRTVERAPDIDLAYVRGFLVHRASGMCAWLRRDVYEEIHGFDERYEGWGGEDLDFVLRLQLAAAFRYFDDPLLHIHHPVASGIVRDDGRPAAVLPQLLTWKPDGPIGRTERFVPVGASREERT